MKKYNAFISYRHSQQGQKYAVALEKALKKYAKPYPWSVPVKVFRDEKHMVPNNDLPTAIKEGLDQSEYLIFLAEKGAAKSTWCREELEYWCGVLKRSDKLIIVRIKDNIFFNHKDKLIDWDKTNAIPKELGAYVNSIPLYLDLKWAIRDSDRTLENLKFKEVINAITAKFKGKTPEEINDEEIRFHKRNKRIKNFAIGLLLVFLFVLTGVTIWALNSQREAVANALISQSLYNSKIGNSTKGFELAKKAVELQDTEESRIALYNSFFKHPYAPVSPYFRNFKEDEKFSNFALSPTEDKIVTISNDSIAKLWNFDGQFITILEGHSGTIKTVKYSDDGKFIMTIGGDGFAIIWDNKGKYLTSIGGQKNFVFDAFFSHNSKHILTCHVTPFALLWDIEGNLLNKFEGHTAAVLQGGFSHDDRLVFTASQDSSIRIWNVEKPNFGELVSIINGHSSEFIVAEFSPTENILLSGPFVPDSKLVPMEEKNSILSKITPSGTDAKLWTKEGKEIASVHAGRFSGPRQISFSKDGNFFATLSVSNNLRIWDKKGNLVNILQGHTDHLISSEFLHGGREIMTISHDKTIKIWDIYNIYFEAPIKYNLVGHSNTLIKAQVEPRLSKKLYSVGLDSLIKVWDIDGRHYFDEPLMNNRQFNEVISTNFPSYGDYFVTRKEYEKIPAFLRNHRGEVIAEVGSHTSKVNSAYFHPNKEILITSESDSTAKLWTLKGELLYTYGPHGSSVSNAFISNNGKEVITISKENGVFLWNIEGTKSIQLTESNSVKQVYFPICDSLIILHHYQGEVNIVNKNGELQKKLDNARDSVYQSFISPSGKYIVTIQGGFNSDVANFWNADGTLIKSFPISGEKSKFYNACFSRDETKIVFDFSNFGPVIYSIEMKKAELIEGRQIIGSNNSVFSPDGNFLAVPYCCYDMKGIINIYNQKFDFLFELDGLYGFDDREITFSEDSQYIVSFSLGNIEIWNNQGEKIISLETGLDIMDVKFSAGNNLIMVIPWNSFGDRIIIPFSPESILSIGSN